MKTIQTRTAAVLLIVAGSIAPAFAQGPGRGQGRDDRRQEQGDRRGRDRGNFDNRGNNDRSNNDRRNFDRSDNNGRDRNFRNSDRVPDRQQFQSRSDNLDRNRQPQYYRQDNYRQNNYRQDSYRQDNYRGGNSLGFRQGGGLRWSDRGGYRGRVIPRDRFNRSFGRQNFFRLGRPAYYNGFPQYSYGGFGFQFMDVVPTYWGSNWYDTDDVYLDYVDDGYYLYNRSYPGVGLAININF